MFAYHEGRCLLDIWEDHTYEVDKVGSQHLNVQVLLLRDFRARYVLRLPCDVLGVLPRKDRVHLPCPRQSYDKTPHSPLLISVTSFAMHAKVSPE